MWFGAIVKSVEPRGHDARELGITNPDSRLRPARLDSTGNSQQ